MQQTNQPIKILLATDEGKLSLWKLNLVLELVKKGNVSNLYFVSTQATGKKFVGNKRVNTFVTANHPLFSIKSEFPEATEITVEDLKSIAHDFIINLSDTFSVNNLPFILKGSILEFRFSKNFLHNPFEGVINAILKNENVFETFLLKTINGKQEVVRKGSFRLFNYSYEKTLKSVFTELNNWMPYSIKSEAGEIASPDLLPIDVKNQEVKRPMLNNWLYYFIKKNYSTLSHYFNLFFLQDQWHIGIIYQPIENFLSKNFNYKTEWLPHPKANGFYADPFGYVLNEKIYIYLEDLSYDDKIARLTCFSKTLKGKTWDSQTALKLSHHLSYPYIIEYKNKRYCIPECCASHNLSIYEIAENQTLLFVKNIVENIDIVDPTLFFYQNKWWLFATLKHDLPNTKLFVWFADDLFGPYTTHQANPVKIDVAGARPGGTVFMHENNLYRPAQDSSKSYGGQLKLQKITRLSVNEFEEETVAVLSPEKNNPFTKGIHNIASIGNYVVIDGKRTVLKFNLKLPLKLFKKFFN